MPVKTFTDFEVEDCPFNGIYCSDGASTIQGLVGKPQNPATSRWFFTQQHGKNIIYEILTAK